MSYIKVNEDLEGLLSNIKCFALDLDGTFYLSNTMIPGSLSFLEKLQQRGISFVFVTNNSSKSCRAYVKKLATMGVEIDEKYIISSGRATIEYLKREHYGKKVFLLGNPMLIEEFIEKGIVIDDKNPDIVITAYDTTIDYEKMCKVCDFVRAGLPYIATHPDYNCPIVGGYIPDIGAIHAFIHASTGRMPEIIIGKPYKEIMECALNQMGHNADETAMIGDRLYTDIAMSQHVPGLTGVLVLSGESTLADVETAEVKPHLVFDNLAAIAKLI